MRLYGQLCQLEGEKRQLARVRGLLDVRKSTPMEQDSGDWELLNAEPGQEGHVDACGLDLPKHRPGHCPPHVSAMRLLEKVKEAEREKQDLAVAVIQMIQRKACHRKLLKMYRKMYHGRQANRRYGGREPNLR